MKTYLLPLVGILLGGMIVFWVFSIAFATPTAAVLPEGLLALGLVSKEHRNTQKYIQNKAIWELVLRRSDAGESSLELRARRQHS